MSEGAPSVDHVFEDEWDPEGWGQEDDGAWRDVDSLPPVPEDMLLAPRPGDDALDDEWWQIQQAMMSPAERFEEQYGLHAVPDPAHVDAASIEGAAALMQDLAEQAARMLSMAEAHHVNALLSAYEVSMQDVETRFGSRLAGRAGLGAQTFFKSMALLTRRSPMTIARQVDAATILRDRMPKTWAVFLLGETTWTRAELAVRSADGLDAEHWPAYDERAAALVVTSTRLKDDLRKTRERLQDDTAAKRARTTHERRHTLLELGADGGAAFVASGLAADWLPVAEALQKAAVAAHGAEGETRSVSALRHDIALDLLDEGLRRHAEDGSRVPQRRPATVTLVLTVPALAWLGHTTEQAQLGGYGPIDMETAKRLAGTATSFIRVLTDPVTGVRLTMDRRTHKPPVDLDRWVRIRDGRSRFPGSNRSAWLCDVDHAREWQHLGPTNDVNLITLDRPTHNAKSAGLIEEALLDSGVVDWRNLWGSRFSDPPNDPLDPAPPALLPRSATPHDDDAPCPF